MAHDALVHAVSPMEERAHAGIVRFEHGAMRQPNRVLVPEQGMAQRAVRRGDARELPGLHLAYMPPIDVPMIRTGFTSAASFFNIGNASAGSTGMSGATTFTSPPVGANSFLSRFTVPLEPAEAKPWKYSMFIFLLLIPFQHSRQHLGQEPARLLLDPACLALPEAPPGPPRSAPRI